MRVCFFVCVPLCVCPQVMAVGRKRDGVFLVIEYCQHDLAALIDTMAQHQRFSESEVKSLLTQVPPTPSSDGSTTVGLSGSHEGRRPSFSYRIDLPVSRTHPVDVYTDLYSV